MLTPASVSQNEEFKQHMASLSVPVLRIVNRRDLVPQIPGASQLRVALSCISICMGLQSSDSRVPRTCWQYRAATAVRHDAGTAAQLRSGGQLHRQGLHMADDPYSADVLSAVRCRPCDGLHLHLKILCGFTG